MARDHHTLKMWRVERRQAPWTCYYSVYTISFLSTRRWMWLMIDWHAARTRSITEQLFGVLVNRVSPGSYSSSTLKSIEAGIHIWRANKASSRVSAPPQLSGLLYARRSKKYSVTLGPKLDPGVKHSTAAGSYRRQTRSQRGEGHALYKGQAFSDRKRNA